MPTPAGEPVATLPVEGAPRGRRTATPPAGLLRALRDDLGRGAAAVRAHLALIATVSVVSAIATVGSPLLFSRPLVLIALCPRLVFLGLAAPQVPFEAFLAVGLLRLSLTDPAHYVIGRTVGQPMLAGLLGHRRVVGRLARGCPTGRALAATAVLVRPNGMYLLLAGAQRVPPWMVAPMALSGTTAYLCAVHAGVGFLVR